MRSFAIWMSGARECCHGGYISEVPSTEFAGVFLLLATFVRHMWPFAVWMSSARECCHGGYISELPATIFADVHIPHFTLKWLVFTSSLGMTATTERRQ
jgi:hypothetical protein